MQRLTLFMIASVITIPYLTNGDKWHRGQLLPGIAGLIPELLGVIALGIVIALGARDRFRYVRPAYVVVFAALLLTIVCGIIANSVDSGPIIAGLRLYLRAIPWFFLPAVYAFTNRQLRTQLLLLMALCLLQIPLAIEQRIHTANATWGIVAVTGDWTTGTMGDSGVLSIFLIAGACVLVAMYEKKRISLPVFLPLFLLILLPTTINETKAVVIFLPIGLLVALMCAARPAVRMRKFFVGAMLLLVFGSIFVPVYDAMNANREYSGKLSDFFLNKQNVENYLGGEPNASEIDPGRLGALRLAAARLTEDPVRFTFGYGVGNASESAFGASFTGRYGKQFHNYLQGALARFLLEIGWSGVLLVYILYWLIFQDCRRVARTGEGIHASLAAGWAGVVAVVCVGMLYALLEAFPPISFLFWYLSGLIAAQRMRLALGAEPAKVRSVNEGNRMPPPTQHGLAVRVRRDRLV
jgi:hypothetical protein